MDFETPRSIVEYFHMLSAKYREVVSGKNQTLKYLDRLLQSVTNS